MDPLHSHVGHSSRLPRPRRPRKRGPVVRTCANMGQVARRVPRGPMWTPRPPGTGRRLSCKPGDASRSASSRCRWPSARPLPRCSGSERRQRVPGRRGHPAAVPLAERALTGATDRGPISSAPTTSWSGARSRQEALGGALWTDAVRGRHGRSPRTALRDRDVRFTPQPPRPMPGRRAWRSRKPLALREQLTRLGEARAAADPRQRRPRTSQPHVGRPRRPPTVSGRGATGGKGGLLQAPARTWQCCPALSIVRAGPSLFGILLVLGTAACVSRSTSTPVFDHLIVGIPLLGGVVELGGDRAGRVRRLPRLQSRPVSIRPTCCRCRCRWRRRSMSRAAWSVGAWAWRRSRCPYGRRSHREIARLSSSSVPVRPS